MLRYCAGLIALLAVVIAAQAASGGVITGSNHDLSAVSAGFKHAGDFYNDYDEVCIYCHTPHGALPAVPLWNRDMYQGDYTLYSSQTLDAVLEQPSLTGVSRMCLSCHDGTIAIDALVNEPNKSFTLSNVHMGMARAGQVGGTAEKCGTCHTDDSVTRSFMTTDISNHHPVSFPYTDGLAGIDGKLETPSDTPSGLGGTIALDMLVNDYVECSTCHNVHDPDIIPFMIKSNEGSALCVTCHNL
jgi:predicted CXXCH cytochrome family protein